MISQRRVTIRDHSAEANQFARRAILALVGVLILLLVLLGNSYQLQVEKFEQYRTRADGNRIKVQPVAPNRGLIYDSKGNILAKNQPIYSLEVLPVEVSKIDELLVQIRQLIELDDEQVEDFKQTYKQYRRRRFRPVVLKSRLTEEEAAVLSVHLHRLDGVYIEAHLKRFYPYGELLTHALGYVARINRDDAYRLEMDGKEANYAATRDIGKLGLEKYYQDLMHGEVGYREVEVNSRGRAIRELSLEPPVPGQDLHLHLDVGLQKVAKAALKQKRGAVVVLNAKDNGILAFYSNPSYDANLFVHGISSKNYKALLSSKDKPLINRATQGQYPPASTIKPHIALLGLDEKLITADTRIWDAGFFKIKNVDRKYRDWKRWGHGWVDVYKALEESCDTYFYDLALRLGMDRISPKMTQFGFGESTGVDIYEESNAIMPSREWKRVRYRQPWYAGDTVAIGIGQSYWTATPLQLALSTSVIANDGVFFEPKLLKSLSDKNGTQDIPAQDRPPVLLNDAANWQIVQEAMMNTVHKPNGTAHKAFLGIDYKAAGKTGTAQVISIAQGEEYDENAINERHRDNAMFVGYAPYVNPEVVISVVVENTGGGGSTAAPIARQLLDYYFANRPESDVIPSESPSSNPELSEPGTSEPETTSMTQQAESINHGD